MRTADFDFNLPRELIALRPSGKRDCSRLLILHRDGSIEHKHFFDIAEYLHEGDMMVLNDTKVFPARIIGNKADGHSVDMLLIKEADGELANEIANDIAWEILCKGSDDGPVTVFGGIEAGIVSRYNGKGKKKYLRLPESAAARLNELVWKYGYMPLPPYIKRQPEDSDKERYQTVYAVQQGSIAAPTAGLHFTDELISKIREKGVLLRFLTLHVGPGTFKPVRSELLEDHRMDAEYFEIDRTVMQEIRQVKKCGGKVIAVGTTTTRTLEGIASGNAAIFNDVKSPDSRLPGSAIRGATDIFIYPGYSFRAVDCLLTNFHLPRSTPLMLAAALSGFDKIEKAYREAAAMHYRFFSYGDAMLIL